MVKIQFSREYVRDSLDVLKQRGLKALVLGTKAKLSDQEKQLLSDLKTDYPQYKSESARRGSLKKIDPLHKGSGLVYLLSSPSDSKSSLVVLEEDSKVTNGPDLWLYLSDSNNPRKTLGNYIDLGLLKGNKGGQVYKVDKPLAKLDSYKSVIVYCKQFDVLFSYATLE